MASSLFLGGGGGGGGGGVLGTHGRVGYGYTWAGGLVQFFSKDPSDDTSV